MSASESITSNTEASFPSLSVSLYLALSRPSPSQRAHFALYIPSTSSMSLDPNSEGRGTLIHVVGAPMAGFQHEVLKEHACWKARPKRACTRLGELRLQGAADGDDEGVVKEVEKSAMRTRPPGISENFMAPVDGVKNRRCQEWTMEVLEQIVKKGWIGEEAWVIAQGLRDPPDFGIGLRKVGDGKSVKEKGTVGE